MGIETALLVGTLISAGTSIVGGIQQKNAADAQADEASRAAEEQMRTEARENIALEKRQKLAFLKSGVSLTGTPLAVLAETHRIGNQNIEEIGRAGSAKAASYKASGRSAMIQGIGQGIGTLAGGISPSSGVENMGRTTTSNPTGTIKPTRRPIPSSLR